MVLKGENIQYSVVCLCNWPHDLVTLVNNMKTDIIFKFFYLFFIHIVVLIFSVSFFFC